MNEGTASQSKLDYTNQIRTSIPPMMISGIPVFPKFNDALTMDAAVVNAEAVNII